MQNIGNLLPRVLGEAENIEENVRLRETGRLGVELTLADDGVHDFFLILPVHDRETPLPTQLGGVATENLVSDGVKSAAPDVLCLVGDELFDALQHLPGRLVREGEEEDIFRCNPVVEKVGDAVGQCPRFAASGSGNDERRAGRCRHGGELSIIQFLPVIDFRFRAFRNTIDCVVTSHPRGTLFPVAALCANKMR